MMDREQKLKDLVCSFKTKHEQVLSHLSTLTIAKGREEASGTRYTGMVRSSEGTQQNLENSHKKHSGAMDKETTVERPKLRRVKSDGNMLAPSSNQSRSRRHSLQNPPSTRLPKIPSRGRSSKTTRSSIDGGSQIKLFKTGHHFNKPDRGKGGLQNYDFDRPRSASDGGCPTPGLIRSRAVTKVPRESSTWRIKLHSRCLEFSDEEGCM